MKALLLRSVVGSVLGATLACCPGCVLATDLVNPNVFASLGLDPDTITAPPGRIVVAFSNETSFPARFNVVVPGDSGTLVVASQLVQGGDFGNVVFDCPVDFLAPGERSDDLVTPAPEMAIEVLADEDIVVVPYTGSLLQAGDDYFCGDVIEIRLLQIGGGDAAADFAIQVVRLPGR